MACTAGNLSTVLSGYLYDVYDLTVTGTIDARDFKTMRDDMPILRIINLSGATISAYSGNMGTVGNYPTIYPENEVPAWAFSNSYSGIGKPITSFIYPTGITSIDSYAFNNCDKITGLLNLPTTVKSIGKYAFYKCKGFTGALVIPPSVEIIGEHVFDQCTSFTDLTISPLVKTISDYAFYYCTGITSPLALPPSVEIIGKYAFYNCSGITGKLIIPASVITIGDYAFAFDTGITGLLTIPSSVTTIGENAFYRYKDAIQVELDNKNYTSIDGVLFNKNITTLIKYPTTKTGDYTIPESVTTIGNYAFNGCNELKGRLNIPSSVTIIGEGAFAYCFGLTSVTIPASCISEEKQ